MKVQVGMRKALTALSAALALALAPPAFADGPLPPSLRSAGVTQEQWDALQTEVRRAAARANVSERALASVAERLGLALATRGGRVDVSDILSELEQLATRIGELEASLAAISRQEDPAIAALVAQARNAIGAGDLDAADAALADARRARAARNAQLQAELVAGRLEESAIVAAQAHVASLRRDHLRAAALFDEAAALAPEVSQERYIQTASSGLSFYDASRDGPDVAEAQLLHQAVDRFDAAIAMPRAIQRSPRTPRMSRSDALLRLIALGEPDAPARAVAAYEADLIAITREEDPWFWSETQLNLGRALQVQHASSGGGDVALLQRAAAAYEAALTVLTLGGSRDNDWSAAQANLGDVLMRLDEHGEAGALERAIAAYEQANRHDFMRILNLNVWAERKIKLGNALRLMGGRQASPQEARDYYDAAHREYRLTLSFLADVSSPEYIAVRTDAYYNQALTLRVMGRMYLYDARMAARNALAGAQTLGDATMIEQIQALITQLSPQ